MKLVIFDIEKTTVNMASCRPYDDIVDVTTGLKQYGITEILTGLKQRGVKTAFVSAASQELAQQFNEELFCGLVDTAYGSPHLLWNN